MIYSCCHGNQLHLRLVQAITSGGGREKNRNISLGSNVVHNLPMPAPNNDL